jgi:hypothetical protein
MNLIIQSIFFQYYKEVKASGLKLKNPQLEIDQINTSRRRTGGCCEIVVENSYDSGMYVTMYEGKGLFAIDGYGLQSVDGKIIDEQFDSTGKFSDQCKYEVSISYNNSRTYDCAALKSRKLDGTIVKGIMEMLPKAMKDYVK